MVSEAIKVPMAAKYPLPPKVSDLAKTIIFLRYLDLCYVLVPCPPHIKDLLSIIG